MSGQTLRVIPTETPVTELKLNADGSRLAGVIRASDTVVVWDTATGEVIQKMKVPGPVFLDLAISDDGRMVAASAGKVTGGETVMVFDATTGQTLHNLSGYSEVAFSVAFSGDGKLLATGDGDATVKLWDAASGKLLRTMEGHTHLARSVAFSPDGRRIVSGGGKNEIKVWSVSSGKLLVTMAAFTDGNWVAFTPEGYYDCSEGGARYITWRVGKDLVDESKYRLQFHKPEMVAERLRD
jgi:WD40 repeat protein